VSGFSRSRFKLNFVILYYAFEKIVSVIRIFDGCLSAFLTLFQKYLYKKEKSNFKRKYIKVNVNELGFIFFSVKTFRNVKARGR